MDEDYTNFNKHVATYIANSLLHMSERVL